MTAAELAGGPKEFRSPIASGVADADDFCVGQVVSHPLYGLGRIAVVEGEGSGRKGTVAFAVGPRRTFILAKSPLQPVGKPGSGGGRMQAEGDRSP